MRSIEKIIFNTLASRQSIGLPDVGALSVSHIAAEYVGDEVKGPISTVIFSEEWPEGTVSIVEQIAELGVEREVAQHNYENWLGRANSDSGLFIKGVGVLKAGKFYMTKSLDRSLNPLHEDSVPAERPKAGGLSRQEKTWVALIVGFVIILAAGWGFWYYFGMDGKVRNRHHEPVKISKVDESRDVKGAVDGEYDAVDDIEGVEGATEASGERGAAVEEGRKPSPRSTPVTARGGKENFYVVGGVFSVPANADNYIELVKKAYPGAKTKKMKYKGNIMVTLYGAETEREAANKRNAIAAEMYNDEIWIYKWNANNEY